MVDCDPLSARRRPMLANQSPPDLRLDCFPARSSAEDGDKILCRLANEAVFREGANPAGMSLGGAECWAIAGRVDFSPTSSRKPEAFLLPPRLIPSQLANLLIDDVRLFVGFSDLTSPGKSFDVTPCGIKLLRFVCLF